MSRCIEWVCGDDREGVLKGCDDSEGGLTNGCIGQMMRDMMLQ